MGCFDSNARNAMSSRAALVGIALAAITLSPVAVAGSSSLDESQASTTALAAVTPVVAVDLQRYLGLWYEIARIPAWFQSGCVRATTARYQRKDDGRIEVLNACIRRNGSFDEARGVARVIDRSSNARLQVSFFSVLGWRPFWGDYWIIGLDPDYRWAVIGDPGRRYGWILSRTPALDGATLATTFQVLEQNGYRRSRFVLTPHDPTGFKPDSPSN